MLKSRKLPSHIPEIVALPAAACLPLLSLLLLFGLLLFCMPVMALHAQDAQLDKAPAAAKTVKNPYADEAGAAEAGSKVYAANCTKCHGVDAKGTGMVPSLLKPATQSATDGTLFWFITQGDVDDGMPPWARLPAKQRWEVVTFIKSLGAAQAKPEATDKH